MKKTILTLISVTLSFIGAAQITELPNGNVGIGTTAPSEKLDVRGIIKVGKANNQDNNSPGLTAVSNDDFLYDEEYINQYGFGFHGFQDGTTSFVNPLNSYISGHFGIDFFAASVNRMRISRNGNIGIGTLDTGNGLLTLNGTNTNLLRLENDGFGNEATLRFRSRSNSGSMLHSDISLYTTGNNQGYLGFKVPHNNTTNSGYDMIINHEGNIGIGTTNPKERLTISGPGVALGIYDTNPASNANNRFARYGNSLVIQNDLSGSWKDNVIFGDTGNVAIGTRDPGSWKLAVNGKIRAKEIKVETGWSDFVFYDDYKLSSLSEVENHIKEKGHLKDIPSAKEVEKEGIFLGEMDSKLLQKIEELTLYTIQQEKKIKKLEEENKELKSLSVRLTEIEKILNSKK